MILRLLKNHPITARNLRRETLTKLTPTQDVASKSTTRSAIKAALAVLIGLTTSQSLLAQDGLPIPSANAQTVRLSDLAPEVASQIKAEHYAAQDQNIQQAYHQQLQANRQRAAFSAQAAAYEQTAFDRPSNGGFAPAAYQAPLGTQAPAAQASHNAAFPRTAANAPDKPIAPTPSTPTPSSGYAAPQTFMPPVHIPPMQPRYATGVPGRSMNGRYNAVQNFAPQTTRNRAAASPHNQAPVRRLQRNDNLVQPRRITDQRSPQEDTHVFLQDRISNALSRHFKRGARTKENQPPVEQITANELANESVANSAAKSAAKSVIEVATTSAPKYRAPDNTRTAQPSEIVYSEHQPANQATAISDDMPTVSEKFVDDQSYSEILSGNKYASRISGDVIVSGDRPADHIMVAKSDARKRSIQRAVHHHSDTSDQPFDISVGEEDSSIFDRFENIRQTSGEHHPLEAQPVRRSKKSRARVAAYPRPDKYSRSNRDVPTENVSILLQEEDDAKPSNERREDFSPRDDFDLEPERDRDFDTNDRPNLRDDLRDADEQMDRRDRSLRDRVRSRLDDELDLEDLDRELDKELDEEIDNEDFDDNRPNRAPRKTCRQFQEELIAGSIRDISLDISPPAASEGAQYGGLARTWTDRRGNTLATGALVDLRRGYVILDSGQKLAYARLSEADLSAVSEFWRLPEVCVIDNRGGSPYRNWTPQVVTWKASNLCHKPLYFENTQLERYGHSRGPIAQPIHSTLHFFTRLVALPYMTGMCPPNECEYALGYYRPGNCAPWLKDPVPISLQGIRREALFVTGAAFVP